jgi:2-polyprenyl-6-methoxyphenol hydroxylase-like FAD-dependent oxidoreductase
LRELLLDALELNTVHWGYDLTEATALENGRYERCFQNGEMDTVDLFVAADGAFSRTLI